MATTVREQTALPREAQKVRDANAQGHSEAFDYDHKNFDYVLVQRDSAGLNLSPCDVPGYRKMGWKVATDDPDVTEHEAMVLMARPKAIGDKERAEIHRKNTQGYKKAGDSASHEELKEGVVQRKSAIRLDELKSNLPSEEVAARTDRVMEQNAARLADNPHLRRAAQEALSDE